MNLMLSAASPAIIFAANLAIAGFTTPVLARIESAYLLDLNTMRGTLLGTGYTIGRGINDAGQVVGVSASHAFITGPDGVGMTNLGTLGGRYSEVYAVNDLGQVAGQSNTNRGYGVLSSPAHKVKEWWKSARRAIVRNIVSLRELITPGRRLVIST